MSYTVKIRASSKADAKAQLATEMARVRTTQTDDVDHTLAIHNAGRVVDLLVEDPNVGVDLDVNGSSKVVDGKTVSASVNVSAQAVKLPVEHLDGLPTRKPEVEKTPDAKK